MRTRNIYPALLLAFALLTGCLKEDYSYCPPGLYVTFDAINPKHAYPELVDNVSLYLYNPTSGELVQKFNYTRADLRPGDMAAFVPFTTPGTYRLLAVVNDNIYTNSYAQQNYATFHTTVNEEALTHNTEPFFSGEREITIEDGVRETPPEERVMLAKHNNNIYLHLEYLDYEPLTGTNLTAWIESSNRTFHHESYTNPDGHKLTSNHWSRTNNFDVDETHHLPYHPAEFRFSTMRLCHGSDMTLHIMEEPDTRANEGDMRYITVDIDDVLAQMKNPVTGELIYDTDEELEYHDEYHITVQLGQGDNPIVINYGVFQMTIQVQKWNYIHSGIGL